MKDILHVFEKIYEHMDIECFSLSVCLPGGFGASGKRNFIDRYYEYKKKQIIKHAEKYFLPYAIKETEAAAAGSGVFRPWLLKGSCTLTYNDDRYISFFREYTVFRGRTVYAYAAESETWDLLRRQLCPLDVFIPEKKTIKAFISEYAHRDQELRKHLLKGFDRDNYYLTQRGAVIYYPDKHLHLTISNTKELINKKASPR